VQMAMQLEQISLTNPTFICFPKHEVVFKPLTPPDPPGFTLTLAEAKPFGTPTEHRGVAFPRHPRRFSNFSPQSSQEVPRLSQDIPRQPSPATANTHVSASNDRPVSLCPGIHVIAPRK
jgi:hypothetical protein